MFHKIFKKANVEDSTIFSEVRAENDEGVFSGYICIWDQIDSYRTKFARGSFSKTIQKDFSKIKVFYDHDKLIGKPLEMREDDTGVFVRGQINLNTSVGKDTWEFLKNGEINGLSFRFRATKADKFENGIRVIQEVEVREFGPVVFQAGEASLVTELRAATFVQNLTAEQLRAERYQMLDALVSTLSNIHWEHNPNANTIDLITTAINEFQITYLDWAARFYSMDNAIRAEVLAQNELAASVVKDMEGRSVAEYAADTGLSESDVQLLQNGQLIENRDALSKLSTEVRTSHQKLRSKYMEELCWELRAGQLTSFETQRLQNLIQRSAPESYDSVLQALLKIQTTK